jgi:hypothetical protein
MKQSMTFEVSDDGTSREGGTARPVLHGRTADSENPTTSVFGRHDTLGVTRNSKSRIRYNRVNEIAGVAY